MEKEKEEIIKKIVKLLKEYSLTNEEQSHILADTISFLAYKGGMKNE